MTTYLLHDSAGEPVSVGTVVADLYGRVFLFEPELGCTSNFGFVFYKE